MTTTTTPGTVTTAIGSSDDSGHSVALQADGKIIVAGYSDTDSRAKYTDYDFALVRYNPDGSLDTSFSGDGKLTTDFGYSDYGNSVTLQSDGKIIVAGYSGVDFALVRYNTDGTLDTSFSSDGKLTTAFVWFSGPSSVTLQSDGKIIVAGHGYSIDSGRSYIYPDFALARYNRDGTLDTSFSGDGKLTTDFGSSDDRGNSVTLQSDGKIIVAGQSGSTRYENYDFALVRYNPDGSLDTSFSSDGKLTTAIGSSDDRGNSVTLQSDGKIIVAGHSYNGSNNDFALARYNTDGSLDTSFSSDGRLNTDFGLDDDYGHSVTLQPDGKILVAGSSYNGSNTDFALVRYNPDGSLDTSFSSDGKLTTDFGSYDDRGNSVTLQSDGKILVAGSSDNGSNYDFALVRYNRDGSLDTTFGVPSAAQNNPPTLSNAIFTIAENSAAGITVGTIRGTDPNSDALTYRITSGNNDLDGDGQNAFALNASGALTVNDSGDLDFERQKTFTLGVEVKDSGGLTGNATITVNLSDVFENNPPTLSNAIFTIAENSEAGITVGTIRGTDPNSDALTYRITSGNNDLDGDGQNAFALNASGALTVNDSGDLDFERQKTFTLGVEVKDSGGLTANATITVNVSDVFENNPPTLSNAIFTIAENSAAGITFGTIRGTDPNGDALTYRITSGNNNLDGDGQNAFALNASGALTVNDSGDLDFERQKTFTLGVEVKDSGGLTGNGIVTVNLSDVLEIVKKPGVTITPLQTPSITSEGNALVTGISGGQAKFHVVLDSQPTANVKITFTSSNPAEGKPVNSDLTFTPSNWNSTQTLIIQGQDDLRDDGDVAYVISGTVISNDIDYYRGIVVPNQELKNLGDAEDIQQILSGDPNGVPTRDRLVGGNGDDKLYGLLNIDELKGGLGNDSLYGGYDDDFLYGENGDDKLYGEQDNDKLYGNEGADTLDGGIGADLMVGGNGADVYYVDEEGDIIDDQGTDKAADIVIIPVAIFYTLGNTLENATLKGIDNSKLTGNALANILTGNSGNNSINGAAGNDTLAGGAGNDTLQGGTGIDTANYATATTAVNVNLTTGKATGEGTDIISTIENILSGKGSDTLTGNSSANNLNGGAGNDIISGGAGRDILIGSAGADKFIYQKLTDTGIGSTARDVIQDFSTAQGDKIDLHLIGAQSFISGAFTGVAGQVRFDSVNHLLQFDLNADKNVDGEIELIGVTTLNAADLIF